MTERTIRTHKTDSPKPTEPEPQRQVHTSVRVGARTYQWENLGGPQSVLTVKRDDKKAVLFDPAVGCQPGKVVNWSVDPRGRMVAVEMREAEKIILINTMTGATIGALPAAAANTTIAWSPERIWYVTGERHLAAYTISTGTVDLIEIPVEAPRRLEVTASPDGRWLLLAALGDTPALWITTKAITGWRNVHFGATRISAWSIGFDDDLYVADDIGNVVKFDLTDPDLAATVLASSQDGRIEAMRALWGGVVVCVRRDGFEQVVEIRRPGTPTTVTLVRWLGQLRLGQVSTPDGDAVHLCLQDLAHRRWWAWITEYTTTLSPGR